MGYFFCVCYLSPIFGSPISCRLNPHVILITPQVVLFFCFFVAHRIHGAGIFTNIYTINDPNVGKYTSTMDPMGWVQGGAP